jgi:hypothetical protein
MLDYNAFIKWAQEKPETRRVQIETKYNNANEVTVWVSDLEMKVGQFVNSVDEIDLERQAQLREFAEFERLKAKFEPELKQVG